MKSALRSCAAAALALTLSTGAQAAGVSLTYLLGGGSLAAGALMFDSWTVDVTDSSDPNFSFDADDIEVTGLADGGMSPGPGLQFDIGNEHLRADGDDVYAYKSLIFSYRVTLIDAALRIVDGSTNLGGFQRLYAQDGLNDLGVLVDGQLGSTAGGSELGINSVVADVLDDLESADLEQTQAFGPLDALFVSNSIFVWAVDSGDTANLSQFTQRFALANAPTQVPAPPGVLLAVTALLAASAAARRQPKR